MNIYCNSLFLLFFFLIFLIILDQNVVDYISTYIRYINITYKRIIWYTLNHPWLILNPISKRIMFQKYYSIAKQLERELKENEGKEKN